VDCHPRFETPILGFRFGSAAYLTDHSAVPSDLWIGLRNLRHTVLDALRYKPHPTHSTVGTVVEDLLDEVKPSALLHSHLPRSAARTPKLPCQPDVRLAYDE